MRSAVGVVGNSLGSYSASNCSRGLNHVDIGEIAPGGNVLYTSGF